MSLSKSPPNENSPFSPASSSCDASHSALALSHASWAPSDAFASASLALPAASAAPAALAAAPAAPVSRARCDSSCSSQARPSLEERNLAEGRKAADDAEVDDDEEEEEEEDDDGDDGVESLLLSTLKIANWSFDGGLASPPRSFRRNLEKMLPSSPLP